MNLKTISNFPVLKTEVFEKQIPEARRHNYMANPKATEIDKLRYEFIKKMNRTEPSETKKQTFKG